MGQIFVPGGGDDSNYRRAALSPFFQAANGGKAGTKIGVVAAGETVKTARESWRVYGQILADVAGPSAVLEPLAVAPDRPLRWQDLAHLQPTGIFVCGGSIPLYHRVLCSELSWVDYLLENEIPYAGTSAGAAIAAEKAILGGWRVDRNGRSRQILFAGAGEGLEQLTVAPGLGLVSFTVEGHAGQLGTINRLAHAVDLGLVDAGWAVDENTTLLIDGDSLQLFGPGLAYQDVLFHLDRESATTER